MIGNGRGCTKSAIEYKIRKYQRGIRIAHRADNPEQRERYQNLISTYAAVVVQLKKALFAETGRCSPRSPKWPL